MSPIYMELHLKIIHFLIKDCNVKIFFLSTNNNIETAEEILSFKEFLDFRKSRRPRLRDFSFPWSFSPCLWTGKLLVAEAIEMSVWGRGLSPFEKFGPLSSQPIQKLDMTKFSWGKKLKTSTFFFWIFRLFVLEKNWTKQFVVNGKPWLKRIIFFPPLISCCY